MLVDILMHLKVKAGRISLDDVLDILGDKNAFPSTEGLGWEREWKTMSCGMYIDGRHQNRHRKRSFELGLMAAVEFGRYGTGIAAARFWCCS